VHGENEKTVFTLGSFRSRPLFLGMCQNNENRRKQGAKYHGFMGISPPSYYSGRRETARGRSTGISEKGAKKKDEPFHSIERYIKRWRFLLIIVGSDKSKPPMRDR